MLLNGHAIGGTDRAEENLCVIKRFPRPTYLIQPISGVTINLVYFMIMDFYLHSCHFCVIMFVSNLCSSGMEPIEVPLEQNGEQAQICQSKVCADR